MKILLIDIESSPNICAIFGMWKQTVRPSNVIRTGETICWAAKWLGKPGVMFQSKHDSSMDEMLRGAFDLMDEADAVIYYNGDRFDKPVLQKEWIKRGWGLPSPYQTIDLIKTVRRELKIPTGNSMNEVLREFGLVRKLAHEGIELWLSCMDDDPSAWKKMERYNRRDVTVMEPLYKQLLPAIKAHPNYALYTDDTRPCCPKCGSRHLTKQGLTHTKTQSYQQYKCKKCGSWSRKRTTALAPDKREGVLVAA